MLNALNNDPIIWQSFKNSDKDIFEKMYRLHFKNLYGYGMRQLNNSELAKVLIQDLFVKLWLNKSNLGKWLALAHAAVIDPDLQNELVVEGNV